MESALRTSIEQARRAAAAGDARAAIQALLGAWPAHRAPALADAIERLTKSALPVEPSAWEEGVDDVLETGRLVDRLRDGNAALATGLIAKLRSKDDPRVGAAAVRLLEDPPWHATGSRPFWTKLFALLEENPHPRALAKLGKVDYATIINGRSMRGWMEGKRVAALASLERAGAPARISKEERSALDAIRLDTSKSAGTPKPRRHASETELFRAVYESPDDDGPRAVLADFLIERGDPRGELISLQLAPTPEGDKRALALIRKHQKAWLGPVAPYVKYLAYPSVAAKDPRGIDMWWRGGFVAGCILEITRPKLLELGSLPFWSTIERLSSVRIPKGEGGDAALRQFLEGMRALRSLEGTNGKTLELVATIPSLVTRLEGLSSNLSLDTGAARALAKLTALRRLRVTHHGETPTLAPLLGEGVIARLLKFDFESTAGVLLLERPTNDAPFAVHVRGPRPSMLGLAAEVASAGLVGNVTFEDVAKPLRAKLVAAFQGTTRGMKPSRAARAPA